MQHEMKSEVCFKKYIKHAEIKHLSLSQMFIVTFRVVVAFSGTSSEFCAEAWFRL